MYKDTTWAKQIISLQEDDAMSSKGIGSTHS